MKYRMGLDLSAEQIRAGVFDRYGNEYRSFTAKVSQKAKIREYALTLDNVICEIIGDDIEFIGVALRGYTDSKNGVLRDNSCEIRELSGFKICEYIRGKYRIPCRADSFGRCSHLAEYLFKGARIYFSSAMIVLNDEVSGSVMLDGKLFAGKRFAAGDFGHTSLYPMGRKCECGCKGCANEYLSAKAFLKGARAIDSGVKKIEDIFERANDNEKIKRHIFKFCADLQALAVTVNSCLDVDAVIITGTLARYKNAWQDVFYGLLEEKDINVKISACKGGTACLGASML